MRGDHDRRLFAVENDGDAITTGVAEGIGCFCNDSVFPLNDVHLCPEGFALHHGRDAVHRYTGIGIVHHAGHEDGRLIYKLDQFVDRILTSGGRLSSVNDHVAAEVFPAPSLISSFTL